jgi:hypothetical protein
MLNVLPDKQQQQQISKYLQTGLKILFKMDHGSHKKGIVLSMSTFLCYVD